MRIWTLPAAFAAGIFLTAPAAGYGDTVQVQGVVTDVNQNQGVITINRQLGSGEIEKGVKLSVGENARLQGINSLSELKVGDQIHVEANRQLMGPMEVESLYPLNITQNVNQAQRNEDVERQSGLSGQSPMPDETYRQEQGGGEQSVVTEGVSAGSAGMQNVGENPSYGNETGY